MHENKSEEILMSVNEVTIIEAYQAMIEDIRIKLYELTAFKQKISEKLMQTEDQIANTENPNEKYKIRKALGTLILIKQHLDLTILALKNNLEFFQIHYNNYLSEVI